MYKFCLYVCCIFLIACGDNNQEMAGDASPQYVAPPAGLLKNPTFELTERGTIHDWVLLQHTGATSYSITAEEGVASLRRIDEEPWGKFRQVFRGASAQSIQGKTMEFSAEISGEFNELYGAPFAPAGLGVLMKGIPAGANPMFGPVVLFKETAPIVPAVGWVPWQRYAITIDVPSAEEASFIEVELFFMMTYGGVMQVRGPAFVEHD